MTLQQRIVRVRRQYNQWVANQTMEDYALRFTARRARRWSAWEVCNTALGSSSFLALEAIGASITLGYGFTNALVAIGLVCAVIFVVGLPVSYYAARYGVDIDLLTRGAGFGYIGSTITSLIYAAFTFIFFALESAIMATALHILMGVPMGLGYLIVSLGIIPLVTHGITFISRLQRWTQALWLALQIFPAAYLAMHANEAIAPWTGVVGLHTGTSAFTVAGFGLAASVSFSLIAQIGEQVDFLRFLPAKSARNRKRWWMAVILGGPGWILMGGLKLVIGSFLGALLFSQGMDFGEASNPAHMYRAVFQQVFPGPTVALVLCGIFIMVAQIKINVTNAYAGSIAWSNFFSRLTHSHPGRVVWLVFNVCIALLLMELGIYEGLEQILILFSILAASWMGIIFADLVINKPLGLSPRGLEFRRAYLYDINPVGLGSMVIATIVAALVHIDTFGSTVSAFAVFFAFGTALVAAPLIALFTRGRYYLARPPEDMPAQERGVVQCCICEHEFEPEDMIYCPAYDGPVCSLCCTLDARCHDGCKEKARFVDQLRQLMQWVRLPDPMINRAFTPIFGFFAIIALSVSIIGIILYLIYYQTISHNGISDDLLVDVLIKVFAAVILVTGVVVWLLVLARESHRVADEETQRQTLLLMEEIKAHTLTYEKLQKAKEAAESANLAKTRYVVGISHELRAPLNAIFGYAQLLESDRAFPSTYANSIRVIRRSSQHLSGLIEGLLDISKIEAGHLRLNIENMRLPEFLDQIVGMFRLQARDKGIGFTYRVTGTLPAIVHADAKRLRQILINLLSNALKFTERGGITFEVLYRSSQLVEFTVTDTGVGIPPQDVERIFEPFERGLHSREQSIPGMGLGLTITKLLTQILGGDITVSSTLGQGSRFHVRVMLPETMDVPDAFARAERVTGYTGPRQTILAADDDPSQLSLLREILTPLGFRILCTPNGKTCLSMAEEEHPDLVLLDISMPDINGWDLARQFRGDAFAGTPIIMVSANVLECREPREDDIFDDFIIKPFEISTLLEKIAAHLHLTWISDTPSPGPDPGEADVPAHSYLEELLGLAEIGYLQGIRSKLDDIATQCPGCRQFVDRLRTLTDDCDLKGLTATLKGLLNEEIAS